jgi:hypothetical protein
VNLPDWNVLYLSSAKLLILVKKLLMAENPTDMDPAPEVATGAMG